MFVFLWFLHLKLFLLPAVRASRRNIPIAFPECKEIRSHQLHLKRFSFLIPFDFIRPCLP